MAVVITGSNTPTAGGVTYGDGTTYANTAAGAAGGVLYSAGSSAPAFTAAGTSGQLLQSNGASAPSWAAAPAGGSWIYLSTVNASASATADIETTFNSTYDMYAIVAVNLLANSAVAGWGARLKIGGSYQTDSFYGFNTQVSPADATTYSSVAANANLGIIKIDSSDIGSATTNSSSFVLYVPNPSNTNIYKSMYWSGYSVKNTLITRTNGVGAYFNSTSALTGVRIFPFNSNAPSGTLTGTFRLYGIKNS